MDYSYESIEPLLVSSEIEGTTVYCTFQIPGSNQTVQSEARVKRSRSVQSQLQRKVTRQGTNMLRRQASRLIRTAIGGGMMGRMGSTTVRTLMSQDNLGVKFTGEEKREAVLEAFRKVADQFHFDQHTNSWSSAPAASSVSTPSGKVSIKRRGRRQQEEQEAALSPVEEQIQKSPLQSHFEKEILARMLIEIAHADASMSAEEREFLQSMIGSDLGTIDELAAKDPISQIECSELSPGAKETIYMLTWVMSLVDFDMDPSEREVLLEYADMFGFSDQQTQEITLKAKQYMLESAIDVDTSREELFELADKIGLDHTSAERCLIELKKRH